MRGEQRDVRADELLRDVEQTRIADQPDPERIAGDQRVAEVLGPHIRVAARQPGDVLAALLHEALVDHLAGDDVAIAFVARDEIGGDGAGGGHGKGHGGS